MVDEESCVHRVSILQPLGIEKETVETVFGRILKNHTLAWCDPGESSEAQLRVNLAGSRYLVVVNQPIGPGIIEGSDLKMISVSFTGYNHIDLDACRKKGIAVTNVPGYSTSSVAELVAAMAISLLRKINYHDALVRKGDWQAAEAGMELCGKTVGIIGTGQIGLAVARIFSAFGCRILGQSRTPKDEFLSLGGEYREVDELLRLSDIVSLHLPLNGETRGMIGEKELGLMKPSALLLNLSRGGLVNENALIRALKEKRLAGAGLDVFESEPLPPGSPLLSAPNLLLTPHIGYRTREALLRKVETTFLNIADFEAGKNINRVDI